MRKSRPQGPLAFLSTAQRALLISWLRGNKTYAEVSRLLWEKLEIKASKTSVCGFYGRNLEAILGKRAVSPRAEGVSVRVTCYRIGELKLEIRPLLPDDADLASTGNQVASVRAAGVEIIAAGTRPEEIRLVVRPIPEAEDVCSPTALPLPPA